MYDIEIISAEEKDELYTRYWGRYLYTNKAEVYGTCIKLLTDLEWVKDMWESNLYTMGENIRSHGRLVVLEEGEGDPLLKYDPLTKTAFLYNFNYYGWIKSIALAVAGDVLEDNHQIYSVHGAAIDIGGRGISIIAPSKTGKTTHSWGLLTMEEARLVTDDWYFVRISSKRPLVFGSEKNCYVESDIANIWGDYEKLVESAKFDQQGRAIMNVRWVAGANAVIPMTTLYSVVLLKRDPEDERIIREMDTEEAMEYLEAHDFCNPHQLVRSERKMDIRRWFFRNLLEKSKVYMVNTTQTPQESQQVLRERVLGLQGNR
ncbi:MAG: HPr kinase/phosphorylase [Methanomassiliicoccales archaeon]